MNSILVSMYNKRGISSIVIMYNGKLLERNVTKISTDIKDGTSYLQLLDTVLKAMCLVRNVLQNNDIDTRRVVFELNNINVIKWFERSEVKDEYQDKFCEIVDTLEEMPIKYLFVYKKVPYAAKFALNKYIKKVELSTLDNSDIEVEDNIDLELSTLKNNLVERPKLSGLEV